MKRLALFTVAASILAAVLVAAALPRSSDMARVTDPELVVKERLVAVSEGRASVMGQVIHRQAARTTGVSRDTLRFRFDRPVLVTGVLVSVDIYGPELVEVAVGINNEMPYGLEADAWLIHTSDTNDGGPSKIDESVWFGEQGFLVGPDDFIGVGAWLWNGATVEQGVSPEVIVYYQSEGSFK